MPFTRKNLKEDLEDLAPNLGEDPCGDVEGQREWWTG